MKKVLQPMSVMVSALCVVLLSFAAHAKEHHEGHGEHAAQDPPQVGVCVLESMEGYEVEGTLLLTQKEGYVHVTGEVSGLTPGKHGFHIHEFGDLRDPKGLSAGGHYNPTGDPHGGPHSERRHAGDLGNIVANDEGVAKVDTKANGLKLHFALGRSIVVHAEADDLTSQPTGAAGPRAGVGVIGIAQVEE